MMVWANLGIIAGGILALLGILSIAVKLMGVFWRVAISKIVEQLEDLTIEIKELSIRMDTHLEWHADPRQRPARPSNARTDQRNANGRGI